MERANKKRKGHVAGSDGSRTGNARYPLTRRAWVGLALGGTVVTVMGGRWWRNDAGASDADQITVFSSPTCSCCHDWVSHLEQNEFRVTVENVTDVTSVKRKLGVPDSLWSCHTATAGGYVIEGHVPADLIRKVLQEKPRLAGLSVPGMPSGSPGMEGGRKERYEVIAFTAAGVTETYAVR